MTLFAFTFPHRSPIPLQYWRHANRERECRQATAPCPERKKYERREHKDPEARPSKASGHKAGRAADDTEIRQGESGGGRMRRLVGDARANHMRAFTARHRCPGRQPDRRRAASWPRRGEHQRGNRAERDRKRSLRGASVVKGFSQRVGFAGGHGFCKQPLPRPRRIQRRFRKPTHARA